MASPKRGALRLPKLKTSGELLRNAPELARFLGEGEAEAAAASLAASPQQARPRSSPQGGRRRFSDDEMTEEEQLRHDLEHVKLERVALLDSLAKLRADQGKSGGELQQEDIRLLRRELEAKKEKLNELRQGTRQLTSELGRLDLTSRDCEQLMPQAEEELQARAAQLGEELSLVEQEIVEAEAKNELYKLLEVRTRRDHRTAEQEMRDARTLSKDADDDHTTLTKHMHETCAAREEAERELGMAVAMFDQVRADWLRKLKDRRKEVRDLEKRKAEEAARREQQASAQAEQEQAERERAAQQRMEKESVQAHLSEVVPELEALESVWGRLHTICGASTPEDVVAYWQEVRAKEASMRELVRLAEVREGRAKEEVGRLLAERAGVYATSGESARVLGAAQQQEQEAAAAAAAAQAAGEGPAPDGEPATGSEAAPSSNAASGGSEPPGDLPTASSKQHPDPPGLQAGDTGVLEEEKSAMVAAAKRRKQAAEKNFYKLSHVCVAADQGLHLLSVRLQAAMNASQSASQDGSRRRTSVAGRRISSMHRRTSMGQQVRRLSAAGFMEKRQTVQHILMAAGQGEPAHVPVGASIHDRDFFPELSRMLEEVGDKLMRLMAVAVQLEAANAAVSAAQPSGSNEPAEADNQDSSTPPTSAEGKKLQWADRQGTPEEEAGRKEEQSQHASTLPAAAEGERMLRKGFRRRTWAGPAWLNSISSKGQGTTLLAKARISGKQLGRGLAGVNPARMAGYAEEPKDRQEGDVFSMGTSEDNEGVVDRDYLKHRSHKLTHPRTTKGAASAAPSS